MIPIHIVTRVCALALVALLPLTPALAQDQLKVAIGQINNWENQAPTLGQDAGIFKKHNLVLENVGTQGAGETMQPVISGSADLGAGVGVAGALRAFARGAPVRILLPAFTGTGDLFWYVKADSPLKTVKDVTASNTIAYSTIGAIDPDRPVGAIAQGGMQHGTVFRAVDLVALKHAAAPVFDIALAGQFEEQRQGLRRQAVLGIIQNQLTLVGGETAMKALKPLRVRREEIAQLQF